MGRALAKSRGSGLTDKQEMWCNEYLVDLNATQAAMRAGYSEDTAKQMGSENLSKPCLLARLSELGKARWDALAQSQESWLDELQTIANKAMLADKPDFKAAVRAKELIGKAQIFLVDRLKIDLSPEQREQLKVWSDAHGRAVRETLIPALGSDVAEPLMREVNARLRGMLDEAD